MLTEKELHSRSRFGQQQGYFC